MAVVDAHCPYCNELTKVEMSETLMFTYLKCLKCQNQWREMSGVC